MVDRAVDKIGPRLAGLQFAHRVESMTLSPHWLDELRARTSLSAVIGAIGEAHPRGARVEGLLPVPQREDAELHGQRREGLLPLLRLRRAWRRDPLPDRRARPALHGRGQGACRARPAWRSRRRSARPRARRTHVRRCTTSWRRASTGSPSSSPASKAREARAYLKKRGIEPSDRRRASASASRPTAATSSRAALSTLGEDKLVETGLLIKPDEGETYDRFRGRLMIPIRDARGRVHRLRRPHPRRRRAQISQLARHAAVRQGPHALQPRPRRPGEPPGRSA